MARTSTSKKKPRLDDLAGHGDPRAPLDAAAFLSAARPLLGRLEADLRARAAASPAVTRALEERHAKEREAERTAESFAGWSAALATQVAAAWLLSCVFVRTLEDRGLLRQARVAGPGAADSQKLFFQLAPSLTERDYLLTVFRELAQHPAARDLFDAEHSLVWKLSPSADLAKELLALFRAPSAETPAFRFGQPSTRFLGDLYQDLSEDVRKRYALLQTPDFIESFILDRTLEPAIERFGLDDTTIIDPTCGSGHFLLGAFDRLVEHRLRAQPGLDRRVAAKLALDAVHGADINPYAVAIARFRLTLAFLDKAGFTRLSDAPALPLHLVVADSLLHNPHQPQTELAHLPGQASSAWGGDVFALEDDAAARDVLHKQYAAVVGNPPYITEKDQARREKYRALYPRSAARTFSLAAPFCERFFQLARPRGYAGQITANSFMKREFGKKLIEDYLPTVNLELIVNTSGAFIPGHGTPTVLLFGTQEPASSSDVLGVLAKRGEPSTPDDPSKGLVWTSVAEHWQHVGFENDYISVTTVERAALRKHPWSLGGGGAAELKELLEERAVQRLSDLIAEIGRSTHTGEDSAFFMPRACAKRLGFHDESVVPLVKGEQVRDWAIAEDEVSLFPYDHQTARPIGFRTPAEERYYWTLRSVLRDRQDFGEKIEARGLQWFEHSMFFPKRFLQPLGLAFAFVATHNHFVLDRGGKVFNRSAPIIKLPAEATEDDHLALLAYLNSSTACFWMKQSMMNKGGSGVGRGIQDEGWESRFEFDGTKLRNAPLFEAEELRRLGHRLEQAALQRAQRGAARVLEQWSGGDDDGLSRALDEEYAREGQLLTEQVALQEVIDWTVYRLAGLHDDVGLETSSATRPGLRPFEFRLAGDTPTTQWFVRNGYEDPRGTSEAPPGTAAKLRIMRSNAEIGLIETPEYKRRWVVRDRAAETSHAACDRLLREAEATLDTVIMSRRDLVSRVLARPSLRGIARLLDNAEPGAAVAKSIDESAVAFVAAARYTESGLVKFESWTAVWDAQREEDRNQGQATAIVVPPRYERTDFTDYGWGLRGKLDVPKERFISYPGCESDEDGEPVYGWAGWDHLQRAQALAALYLKRKDGEGWAKGRLTPMLAGLLELIPWLEQWHNEPSDDFGGERMGDYFASFLDGECRQHGLTHDDLRAWRPAAKTRGKAKAAAKPASRATEDAADDAPAKPRKRRARKAGPVEADGGPAEE